MPNPWFRMYTEFAHDPKVQMMPEPMQRRLVMLLCLRGEETLETLHETELAFHLRISETELAETKALFIQKGFIDDRWNVENWHKRQFVSDSSTPRVRRHRSGKKQAETLHGSNETLPETPHPVSVTAQNRTEAEQIQSRAEGGDAPSAPPSPPPTTPEPALDPDDEESNIPDDLPSPVMGNFVLQRLSIPHSFGLAVKFASCVDLIARDEGHPRGESARLLLLRARDHPPANGKWGFWLEDGSWKEREGLSTVGWE